MKIDEELKTNLIADVENICGLNLSEEAKESLKRCFEITIGTRMQALDLQCVGGSLPLYKVDQLLKMQIEECRYFAQRCARDYGAASADYDKWIAETPMITLHKQ